MPISNTDQLFNLIKSLTKSEKRNFKIYVNRTHKNTDLRFIKLFEILEKQKSFNEEEIFAKFKNINKGQLSNLKRHLYSKILTSLRQVHIQKNIDLQIREQIDFARILYGKGLYLQSLKILERIKAIAEDKHQEYLILEILEFQKLIESRHITRSRKIKNKMESLIEESEVRSITTHNTSKLANLKLKIHGWYIEIGHIRNQKEKKTVQNYFKKNLEGIQVDNLGFFEKAYLYQSYVWYYYILLEFENCLQYARLWTGIFDQDPNMKLKDPDLYMRGLHYELTCEHYLDDYQSFKKTLNSFKKFKDKYGKEFNDTSCIISFLYYNLSKLNQYFMSGQFTKGIQEIEKLQSSIAEYEDRLDPHRIMVFYYKFAWMYFGAQQYSLALDYLNKIIYLDIKKLRNDIQAYARILTLMIHFELGNWQLLEYHTKSVSRFLDKVEERNIAQKEIINLLNRIIYKDKEDQLAEMEKVRAKLQNLSVNPYDRKSFLYLDTLAWLDSKITNKSLAKVIQFKESGKN